MVTNDVYRVMAIDALASSHPLSFPEDEIQTPAQISEVFDAIAYSKVRVKGGRGFRPPPFPGTKNKRDTLDLLNQEGTEKHRAPLRLQEGHWSPDWQPPAWALKWGEGRCPLSWHVGIHSGRVGSCCLPLTSPPLPLQGASVLRMLSEFLTEDRFKRGLQVRPAWLEGTGASLEQGDPACLAHKGRAAPVPLG